MTNKTHIVIFIFSFLLALIFGGLDYKTHTVLDLFLSKENLFALCVYTLLFMSIGYTGIWMYMEAKTFFKKKPF